MHTCKRTSRPRVLCSHTNTDFTSCAHTWRPHVSHEHVTRPHVVAHEHMLSGFVSNDMSTSRSHTHMVGRHINMCLSFRRQRGIRVVKAHGERSVLKKYASAMKHRRRKEEIQMEMCRNTKQITYIRIHTNTNTKEMHYIDRTSIRVESIAEC